MRFRFWLSLCLVGLISGSLMGGLFWATTAQARSMVPPDRVVERAALAAASACPLSYVSMTATVTNTAGVSDTLIITPSAGAMVTPTVISDVEAGAAVMVSLSVMVPGTAMPGDTLPVTLTVGGQTSGITSEVVLTVTVSPMGDWMDRAFAPIAARAVGVFYAGGYYYQLGGFVSGGSNSSNGFYRYDPVADQWTTMTSLLTPTRWVDPVVISDEIYVVGGFGGPSGAYLNALQIYNVVSGSWRYGASLPVASLARYASVVWNNELYVIGGGTIVASTGSNAVYIYNPISDSWRTGTALNQARLHPAAGVIDGKIYVASGYYAAGGGVLTSTEVYDPISDTWSVLSGSVPGPRSQAADAVLMDRYLVMAGGVITPDNTSAALQFRSVIAYDTVISQWIALADMPRVRANFEGDSNGQTFFVSGGVSGSTYLSVPAVLSPCAAVSSPLMITPTEMAVAMGVTETVATRTLALSNTGTISLSWMITETPPVTWMAAMPMSGTLEAAAEIPITLTFDRSGLTAGVYTTTLWIGDAVSDAFAVDIPITLTVTAEPTATADLSASTKTVSRDTVLVGDLVTYTIQLSNTGGTSATVYYTDTLPPELNWVTGALTGTSVVSAGESISVEIVAQVVSSPTVGNGVTNTVWINDGTTVFTREAVITLVSVITPADLSASYKTATPEDVMVGELITYTIYLSNTGGTSATVYYRDFLPAELSLVTGSITGTPVVNAGELFSVEIVARAVSAPTVGNWVTNTLWINDGTTVFTRYVTVTVRAMTGMAHFTASTKTVLSDTARVGDLVTYTINLSNTGDMSGTVIYTDILPVELTLVTGTLTGTQTVSAGMNMPVLIVARVITLPTVGNWVTNTVLIGHESMVMTRQVTITIESFKVYLPLIFKTAGVRR